LRSLFLNVWAPARAEPNSKLPVKVWLYGGGNSGGGISNALYDACFASKDVIQVSVNYRLGPLGWLAFEKLGIKGNMGLQDQLLALRWVKENIAAFGGDPSKVLLFGESAGSSDTNAIATLPYARDLFSAATLESSALGTVATLAIASNNSQVFIDGLNCTTADLQCLRNAPLEALNATYARTQNSLNLGPIVDGTTVTRQPIEAGLQVPAIIGTNTNEMSLFLIQQFGVFDVVKLNESAFDAYLATAFGAQNVTLIKQHYPLSAYASTPAPVWAAIVAVATHQRYRCPARRALARAQANGVPVWTYSFGVTPSCSWFGPIPNLKPVLDLLGPAHSSEIPYVFGQVEGMPRPNGTCNFSAGEVEISKTMMAAWDSMAASANPGSAWLQFTVQESKGVNVAPGGWQVGTVDYTMCDFWDELAGFKLPTVGNGTGGGATNTGGQSTPTNSPNEAGRTGVWASVALLGLGLFSVLLFWSVY
jgi:carboxylesterase type B